MEENKFVITGEAPESDEEQVQGDAKVCTYARAVSGEAIESDDGQSNAKFWKDLNACVYSAVSNSSRELLNADQQLLKSQVTLQAISHSFKTSEAATKQIIEKMENIISGNFIPSIKI